MRRFKNRLKPILILPLLLLAPVAALAQVTSVTLFNQTNRNIAAGSINNPVIGLAVTLSGTDTFNQ
ncbi:MAG TPA: hypothetical protein VIJ93_12455, partial [bacterium]